MNKMQEIVNNVKNNVKNMVHGMKKCEIESLSEHIHYIPSFTNFGILTTDDGNAYFIDAGANEDYAMPAYEAFLETFPDHNLKAVLITHSHADHVGGCQCLLDASGCEFWASRLDGYVLEMPEIMPSIVTGGLPIIENEIDFYYSKSRVKSSRTLDNTEVFYLGGENEKDANLKIEVIFIPGHWISQIGFLATEIKTGKRVFFAGDGIYGRSEVKKYWIPYNYDEATFMNSIKKIQNIAADITVPSHGNIIPLDILEENIELNSLQMIETEKMILKILEEPKTFEQILKEVAGKNGIHLKVNQAYLIGSTIKSFLSCLQHKSLVKEEVKDNFVLWSKVEVAA